MLWFYKWCYQLIKDAGGTIIDRRVTISEIEVLSSPTSLCSCIDTFQLVQLSLWSHVDKLGISSTGTYGYNVYIAPCWTNIFPGNRKEECARSSCCKVKVKVTYTGTYDMTTGDLILTIDDVVNDGNLIPVVDCDYPCESVCSRWIFPDEDWDDAVDHVDDISTEDLGIGPGPKVKNLNLENEPNIPYSIVYPNPTTGKTSIQMNKKPEGKIVLLITNLSGKVILQKNVTYKEVTGITLDLSNIPDGLYIYKVIDSGITLANGKVIKK